MGLLRRSLKDFETIRAGTAAAKRANRVAEARSDVERARERRRTIAQARVARATNVAAAASTASPTSSPLQGAQSALFASLASGQSAARGAFQTGQEIFSLRQQASDAEAVRRRSEQRSANARAEFGTVISVGSLFL